MHDVFLEFYYCFSDNEETHSKDTTQRQGIGIKVPKIYWNLTRKAVLTMEWLDGIKLTDNDRLRDACLNRKQLIDEVREEGRDPNSVVCLSYLLSTVSVLHWLLCVLLW